jgi:hypothetical protein
LKLDPNLKTPRLEMLLVIIKWYEPTEDCVPTNPLVPCIIYTVNTI